MKISKLLILFIILFYANINATAQREFIRMSSTINHPGLNNFHPFISGDGLTLIYVNDQTDYEGLSLYESTKIGGLWQEGVELPRLINRPDLNFEGGYSLNYDGTFMIITSRKHGLGGYELWYSEKINGNWSAMKNFGLPINSAMHEGSGVLTPDEQEMYFMRCKSIDERSAEGCKLYYTKKKDGRWTEPSVLPENINSYNPQIPRILGDGETLIFSSNKPGGKGGYDLYLTRKTPEGWSDPVNLEFANTEGDDKYVSTPSKGRYLYKVQKGERKYEIVQLLIPKEYKPKQVYRVTGKIFIDSAEPFEADGVVFDAQNRKTISRFTVGKNGAFSIALPEGTTYDLSIIPKSNGYWYFSKIYILDSIPSRDAENLKVEFKKITPEEAVENNSILFDPYSDIISEVSSFELRRLSGILRSNPQYKIKIIAHLYDYREDSIQSDPDLTELRLDTTYVKREVLIPANFLNTSIIDTIYLDTLTTNGIQLQNESDTLFFMVDTDSLYLQNSYGKYSLPAYHQVIDTTFHNDRSKKEAEAIKAALVSRGVEAEKVYIDYIRHKGNEAAERPRRIELVILKE